MFKFCKISLYLKEHFCKIFVFYFSFYLIFFPLFLDSAFAQSLPINPVSNNATLGIPSNNIPVLNITKPTSSGVSVNKFNDLNVGTEGLILNNLNLLNYNITYKSALSNQHVEFNPNFRDGDAAKIILNEVVSNSKTLMNGYTEIYGQKADYIVANPNGITCNGCGFINTSRLSLITGSSNIIDGKIDSFKIAPNATLRINGVGVENFGLYAQSPAELVSNAIKISGEVSTIGDLKVFAGNDRYDWNTQTVSSDNTMGSEVAIDVSSVGGMKADNIYVVATGKGFGVNLDGNLISSGNIEITVDGNIAVKNIIADGKIAIQSNKDIVVKKDSRIASNTLFYAKSANNITTNGDYILSADIYLYPQNDLLNIGKVEANNNLFIDAKNIHNYGRLLSNLDMELSVSNDLINYRGAGILSGGDMNLYIANNLINYKADIYAGGDLKIFGNKDVNVEFTEIDSLTDYDNPYIEKDTALDVADNNIQFILDDEEDEGIVFILSDDTKLSLPQGAFNDGDTAGAKYEYNGYTFILGDETVSEVDVPNPEYQNCIADGCDGIPKTVKSKVFSYNGTDTFTIKDANGNNVSYQIEGKDIDDGSDEDITVSSGTGILQNNMFQNYQTKASGYNFNDRYFNNLLNFAGQIQSGGNLEIVANNISNVAKNVNTGNKSVSTKYDKKRSSACGWTCGWRELGRYEIINTNLDSIPSSIIAGGSLALNAVNFLNNSSIVSSKGDMFLKSSKVSNLAYSEVVNLAVHLQKKKWRHGRIKKSNKTVFDSKRVYSKQRSTIVSGGNLSITASEILNDQNLNPTSGIMASVDNSQVIDGKIQVGVNLPVGDNGLFKVSNNGKYLVETNVPFIKSKDYVGSDYFFNGMGGSLSNGVDERKFIGDSAFETKIVMDAILKATQKHYLENDNIGSDTEQMKRLYDNALDVYQDLGLKVGVALDKEQIANLKKDIIWYVEKEIDGQRVLVPELYLSQATLSSIDSNKGSKVSGFNVGIEADFVSNYGDITADNILQIKSKSLINEGNNDQTATIKSNGITAINADNVLNLSGNIGGDVVQIDADNIVNRTKVLSSDFEGEGVKRHTEIAGATSSITGSNGVSLNANNTLVNSGATIESKFGDVNIKAEIATFNTTQLHNREEKRSTSGNAISKKSKLKITDTIENKVSEISAGGNFNLSTTDDANFAGADVNVGGNALFDIGGDTNITAIKDRIYNYSKTSKSTLGGLYSKKDTVIDENEILKNSNITIKDGLNIISNKDINVVASNIDVGGDANILAGYKLTEDGVEKTSNRSNVNIVNDTEMSQHFEEHKKTNGLDFGNFDISASGGKVSVNADISSARENETTETTKNVVSSNLNIGGNLNIATTNDINIRASNLNANENTSLNADNDINLTNDFNITDSEVIQKDITTSAGVSVGNAYVDVAYATKALIDAEQSVKKAKKELKKIKEARDRGEASNEAVKDAELNLSLAIINFTNAEIALASSIAGAASAAASSYGTGFYISGSLTDDIDKYTENSTFSQAVGSNLTAENISLKSGNNMTHIGSNIIANDTISYDITNKLKVFAGENTYRSESYNEHITAGASYGNNAVQGNVGYDKSRNVASGTSFTNSNIIAENISIKTGNNAEFIGTNVNANENLVASVGGDLIIESKQDTDYAKGKSFGMSLSGGAGVRKEAVGKGSGGIGFNTGKSNHDSSWVNDMTELTAKNVDINVAGKTSLTGAMIDGSESLHLATNELEFKDLHDFERSNETGFGVSTSIGISTNKGETNLHPNGETSLTLKDKGYNKEQITRATIGAGGIIVGGVSNPELDGLNRNVENAQEITKDMITGALDTTANIDNRVFTSEGRADIVKQHENLGENLSQIGNGLRNNIITKTIENTITGDKSLSENFYDYVEQDRQMTELKENRKDLMLALNGMTNFDSEEAKNILQQIADLTAGENGFSGKLQLANVEGNIAGFSYQSNDGEIKNISINLANVDLTKPNELMNVIYHETTNFEEHNRKEQNAKNRGETGAGIFSLKNFGNENTNGMSKTEWIVANADKDTISNGNLGLISDLYNKADKKGDGEPLLISSIVTGLIVTGSLYSIQDSARKIYAWFDGEGYKGNTTYVDPINGEVYTAEGNIKEGAIELATAATAGIAVKGIGKVVSKVKATKALSKATETTKNTKITGIKSVNSVKSVKSSNNNIENFTDSNKLTKKGGIYSDVRIKNKGGEVHHLIADSVSEISRNDAPSILMTKSDHMQTKSWGNSNVSKSFREEQKKLVNQGKNREALAIGIKDVRSQFSSKYNKELLEAIDSTKNNQKINQMFKK